MKWSNLLSLAVTFAASAVILCVGYLGIVEGGRFLLKNESTPELAEYTNTSSNIFYGKIEDDIELFPWNYYPEEQSGQQPAQETEPESGQETEPESGQDTEPMQKEEIYPKRGWYGGNVRKSQEERGFRRMIAYGAGVETKEVDAWYVQKGSDITDNMVLQSESDYGEFYFYQDILELQGKRYQVKLACNDWNILNFSCFPYREQEMQDTPEWKAGRNRITEILKEYPNWTQELFLFLEEWYGQDMLNSMASGTTSSYLVDGSVMDSAGVVPAEDYAGIFFENISYLNEMLQAEAGQESEEIYEKWKTFNLQEFEQYGITKKELENYLSERMDHSCQAVEVNDMILILMQGQMDIGLFYDPVDMKICGFNYFWK